MIYNTSMDTEDRKFCARLIQEVLCGRIITREALKRFPKSNNDRSVIAAYHALIHYEADEEFRKTDIEYKISAIDLRYKSCSSLYSISVLRNSSSAS